MTAPTFDGTETHKPGGPADPKGGGGIRLASWLVTKIARVLYPTPRGSDRA